MVFSSLLFLFVFLPVTLVLYYIAPRKLRNLELLIMSLIFYGWGEPVYILLMLGSIILNYVFGRMIDYYNTKANDKGKKITLIVSVVANLSLLGIFKYTDFAIGTFNHLFGTSKELMNIALPIGISFYTFQAMSYVIDVYRKDAFVNKNIISFGMYITMFPQLIAGPIVRYETIDQEIRTRHENIDDFSEGILRFVCGLGKKVLIANSIGNVWNQISSMDSSLYSTSLAWLGVIAFSFQIYFDFSGYSDMAIGLGKMFGFHFLENFDHPYESGSITEFWRRWHMSLGTWFREYVYYPLGGSRKGLARQLVNIAIVWMLTGLWHGASWNFVLWGAYFAVLLLIEKMFLLKLLNKIPALFSRMYTIVLVFFGWAIFSYNDIADSKGFFKALFFQAKQGVLSKNCAYLLISFGILFVIAAIGSTSVPKKIADKVLGNKSVLRQLFVIVFVAVILLLSTAYMVSDTYNPFLYFRF